MNRTIKYLLTSLLLLPAVLMAQTTYYVSSSEGDDTNPGTSAELAWQSLGKVNSYDASPGDQILFKRGEAWEGTLIVPASGSITKPIVYGAYGTGDKPEIYGSEEVTSWTLHSENIYKAIVEADDVKQLFLDDSRMKSARYPNEGYFDITSVISNTKFTSTDLSGGVDYSGAICFLRNNVWSLNVREVSSSSSQTITLSTAPVYSTAAGSGFWLTNKLDFLTEAGEWYYDSDTNTLYFWAPNGDSPENYTVRASTIDYGVKITSKNFVTVRDLDIKHSGVDGIYISGSKNFTIDNCSIINPDLIGINDRGSSTSGKIINNYISGANGRGISIYNSLNTEITENTIEETGQIANFNKAGFLKPDNLATAINSRGNNHTIHYNRIINSGYCGINFQGLNTDIKYNYINGVCQILDDGGGIYTYSGTSYPNHGRATGSVIENNIILNCFGENAGTTKNYTITAGVYLDDSSRGITAKYNTISGAATGIFIKGGQNVCEYNTVYDAALFVRSGPIHEECQILNSIFYQSDRLSPYVWWPSYHGRFFRDKDSKVITDYNLYIAPYKSTDVFYNNNTYASFTNWQLATKHDASSTFDGTALGAGETEKLFYNDSKQTKIFDLGDTIYRDLEGEQVKGTLTLEPFTSKILIKTNIVSSVGNTGTNSRGIVVYPNPTNGRITVELDKVQTSVDMALFNMEGKQVMKKIVYPASGKLEKTFNISHLNEGTYLLQMISNSQIYNSKVVVKNIVVR